MEEGRQAGHDDTDRHFREVVVQCQVAHTLHALAEEDDEVRAVNLGLVLEEVEHLLANAAQLAVCLSGSEQEASEGEAGALVRAFQRAVLVTTSRAALHSPFSAVRDQLRAFVTAAVQQLQFEDVIAVPRGWLDQRRVAHVPEPGIGNGEFAQLARAAYLKEGHVSHIMRMLAWHPVFLQHYTTTQDHLLLLPGPLPIPWRHYLCIMAASRHNSTYLGEHHMRAFILAQGNEEWLGGLHCAPPKLANIAQVNALLAHQPWRIANAHMDFLLKGAEAWSIPELVHALTLLATTHALCGLVEGLGIEPEMGAVLLPSRKPPRRMPRDKPCSKEHDKAKQESWNAYLESTMKDQAMGAAAHALGEEREDEREQRRQERVRVFETIVSESESDREGADRQKEEGGEGNGPLVEGPPALDRFTGGHALKYDDFDVRSREYKVFRADTFSWGENGYEIARHITPEAADALDAEFRFIFGMTDHSINGVDTPTTQPFRHAIWFYTHRLFGVLHDDFQYELINKNLPRALKAVVKHIACAPETARAQDFDNLEVDLSPREHVHVTLLIVEARRQAELLYALRAVMQHHMKGG